jgi:putative membrane-bound dehydrogenase-like protein
MNAKLLLCSLSLALTYSAVRAAAPAADVVPFAGLSPQDACAKATLPPGFKMYPFAAEPDVVQPIAFALDDRGRVWVAEGITYPRRKGGPPKVERVAGADQTIPVPEQVKDILGGKDRILVFEDTDGDHKFDKKTVFLENVNLISGLEVGFGGVWIGAAPYLLFVPVKDWDNPKPAGDPRILLDGWNFSADTHETLNTFTWGPDGWLYGCHGVFCPSYVGKPGAPNRERQWMDAGVWRYHPTRQVFEVFTEGGSNPWGIDFNEHGQLFAEMCVIPHFWNMIQGARIERQGGQHFPVGAEENARYSKADGTKPVHPHIYEDIKQHGDHVHWAGNAGPHAGNARSDSAGGGHAHAGVMAYLGESWPAEYRDNLIIGNIHGQRFNTDIPVREGSGYVGKHGKDFLNFNDTWSQTLNQTYDQDGSVFVIDWYDRNQCHHNREDGHDRGNGRIYKIVYKDQKATRVDLAKLSDDELISLVTSKNEFKSRHARRILQERIHERAANEDPGDTGPEFAELIKHHNAARKLEGVNKLTEIVDNSNDTPAKLRALWAMHVMNAMKLEDIARWSKSNDEWVRAWTLQLYYERADLIFGGSVDELASRSVESLAEAAEKDPSPLVRRYIASAAQRIPLDKRTDITTALVKRSEDAGDHNLPLMYWFAAEPLVADHPKESLEIALETKLPKLLTFATRRIALLGTTEAREMITEKLAEVTEVAKQLDMLNGLSAALKGQRAVPMPAGWAAVEAKLAKSENPDVRTLAQTVSLTYGSKNALASLRKTLSDKSAALPARRAAMDSLMNAKDAELPGTLQTLLADADLRSASLRALASYNDPKTPDAILAVYGSLDQAQKRDALSTLSSRAAYAKPLLAAIGSNKVPKQDMTAEVVRQLRSVKDNDVQKQVTEIYGLAREVSADKKAEIEKYRRIYGAGGSQPGNASQGRVVYNKVCAQCHTLFDSGGKVGPDITGANRNDLNYLLENMLDPNAVIPNEYRANEIETKDGRSLTGVIKRQDDKSLVLQTANELVTLPRNEIASQRQSQLSMMPEGLLAALTDQEVRDLIYYLTRVGQVPLPAGQASK